MADNNDSHTVKSWLKIAGLITEDEDNPFADEGDDEAAEEETEEEGDEEEEDAEGEEGAEDEEGDEEEEEEKEEEEEPAVPTDVPNFDTELNTFFSDFESSAMSQVESLSLSNTLLEQETRFDVVKFADEVARLIGNFTSLVDYEKLIIDKAQQFLTDKHDEEVAQLFVDMLADRHGISLEPEEPEAEVYAVGASGAGE